jgi:hypothetical protein
MITNFTLFLESGTFKQKTIFSGDYVDFEKYIDKPFIDDAEPLNNVYIEKNSKNIHLHWYDDTTLDHIIKERIKNRTTANSITEFNEIIKKSIIILFTNYFREISTQMSYKKLNRIAVKIQKLDAYIIIEYEPTQIFENYTALTMVTILPELRRVAAINRIFEL